MTDCTPAQLDFPGFKRRKVEVDFTGGHVSSDAGGCLLLRQVDRRLGLLKQVGEDLSDPRRKKSCEHDLTSLALLPLRGMKANEEYNAGGRLLKYCA